jgi:hypothetical protein
MGRRAAWAHPGRAAMGRQGGRGPPMPPAVGGGGGGGEGGRKPPEFRSPSPPLVDLMEESVWMRD